MRLMTLVAASPLTTALSKDRAGEADVSDLLFVCLIVGALGRVQDVVVGESSGNGTGLGWTGFEWLCGV